MRTADAIIINFLIASLLIIIGIVMVKNRIQNKDWNAILAECGVVIVLIGVFVLCIGWKIPTNI